MIPTAVCPAVIWAATNGRKAGLLFERQVKTSSHKDCATALSAFVIVPFPS
jgi:hypothetical protein